MVRVHGGGPWSASMVGSMVRVHGGGPWSGLNGVERKKERKKASKQERKKERKNERKKERYKFYIFHETLHISPFHNFYIFHLFTISP